MMRPSRPRLGALCLGLAVAAALSGCGENEDLRPSSESLTLDRGLGSTPKPGPTSDYGGGGGDPETKRAILENVVRLIESAALAPTAPGSPSNFSMAASNLNYYFEGTPDPEFAMDPAARDYLLPRLKEGGIQSLEDRRFTDRDARHIEDCLLYRSIAARVAGEGDDLTRVRRIFDWVVSQVQLVPLGSLVPPGYPQAQARPYDVLIRGLASELADGDWAERSWVFMALCRQLNVDTGLIVLKRPGTDQFVRWICVVLVDGKPYLFDLRVGLAIPGPGGRGVATLDDAATDPEVLDRLDLPGHSAYGVTAADLAGKVRILVDSGSGIYSPRMRELQEKLAAKNRMILFRDPAAQRDAFRSALGSRLDAVELWPVPLMVETRLFKDPAFVEASLYPLQLFNPQRFAHLLRARLAQLRGRIDGEGGAIQTYVSFRMAEGLIAADGRTPLPAGIRRSLDLYATQFLALCHLDRGRPEQARFLFEQTLTLLDRPGHGLLDPPVRWGAQANLGRLAEDRGDSPAALDYDTRDDPTGQHHGNLLRARDLIWRDPMAPTAIPDGTRPEVR